MFFDLVIPVAAQRKEHRFAGPGILGVWQSLDIPVTNYIEAEYQGRGKLLGVPNEYW